jgi:hypothetical protein
MVVQVLEVDVNDEEDVNEVVYLRPSGKKLHPHPVLERGGLPSRYFAYPKGSLQCKNGNRYSCTNQ